MPNASTIFEGYGIKYNGNDILYLANKGFVEPELPMNMLIYKSLHAQDTNSNSYLEPVSYDSLLDFYSPDKHPNRIRNLVKSGKINQSFVELHQEMLDNVDAPKRKNYINDFLAK